MVNKQNILRDILNRGGTSVSTRLWSPWAFYTEALGATGKYDYMEFVGEYAPFSQDDLENMCRAAELYEMGSMMKVDFYNRAYVAQKAICAGFQSILFADHVTCDQVRETIQLMKPKTPEDGGFFGYPSRRYIGCQPNLPQMDHAARVRDVVLAFMVEKHEMVEHIDELCDIPGVDMIQFGPSDYSMSCGKNRADFKDACFEAERKCIKTALAHGVQPRCEIADADSAKYYLDLGVRHFSIGDQFKVIHTFWEDEGEKIHRTLEDNGLL